MFSDSVGRQRAILFTLGKHLWPEGGGGGGGIDGELWEAGRARKTESTGPMGWHQQKGQKMGKRGERWRVRGRKGKGKWRGGGNRRDWPKMEKIGQNRRKKLKSQMENVIIGWD